MFIDNFNNLLVLIDLKTYGHQFKNQLIFNEIEKKNIDWEKNVNEIYNDSKILIKNKKDEFYNKNKTLKDDFIRNKYHQIEKFNELEKDVQNNINEFSKIINAQIIKLNEIILNLKKEDMKIKKVTIKYNDKKLNKDYKNIQKFIYEDDVIVNIFKGIGNLIININNKIKENSQIEKNIDDYLTEINSLIENNYTTFNSEIDEKKDEIIKIIKTNLTANNISIDGIKKNRFEYEKIKNEYFEIINFK